MNTDDSDTNSDLTSPNVDLSDFCSLPNDSALKPKIDSIFAEVKLSLPELDFDTSDISSDEDYSIFQRSLKTPLYIDDDKDLDESLTADDIEGLLDINEEFRSHEDNTRITQHIDSDNYESRNDTTDQTNHVVSVQDIIQNERPVRLRLQGWVTESSQENSALPRSTNLLETNTDRHEAAEQIRLQSERKQQKLVGKEKSRDKANKVVSKFIPTRGPTLEMTNIKSADIDNLLEKLDVYHAGTGDSQGYARDISIYAAEGLLPRDHAYDEQMLIEKLAMLSRQQSNIASIRPSRTTNTSGQSANHEIPSQSVSGSPNTSVDPNLEHDVVGHSVPSPSEATSFSNKPVIKDYKYAAVKGNKGNASTMSSNNGAVKLNEQKEKSTSGGTNMNDFEQYLASLKVQEALKPDETGTKPDEPGTIVLDLRNYDKIKQEQQQSIERVQRVLQIKDSSRADSSDSEEDDLQQWHAQRKKIRESLAEDGKLPDLLPSKPTPPDGSKGPITPRTQAQHLAHVKPKPITSDDGDSLEQPDVIKPPGELQALKPSASALEFKEEERRKEAVRKMREKKEHERQSKIRLGQRLEALMPKTSISGKKPAAENTPTIFDVGASYEPPPHSLPCDLSCDVETMLLTIRLSSNGVITMHRSSANKSVDIGLGVSGSYTSLLTWLISLVPEDFSFVTDPSTTPSEPKSYNSTTPFNVIGLQQMWLDGQLALYVAITPSKHYMANASRKSKAKDNLIFQQTVSKYLSTSTLHSVSPWLQDLVPGEISPPGGEDSDTFIYRPPLPTFTLKPLSTFIQINTDTKAVEKVLNTPLGFFWQTIDLDETSLDMNFVDDKVDYQTQTTLALVYKRIYKDPAAMMGILQRILQEGLDLAGIRLVYPAASILTETSHSSDYPHIQGNQSSSSGGQSHANFINNVGPIIALAIRGTFARTIWLDALGPADPVLARRTDPGSLCALYGGDSREECLMFCPRNPSRIYTELARWFGGRVPASGVIDTGCTQSYKKRRRSGSPKAKKVSFDTAEAESNIQTHRPPACLLASTCSDVFVVISPLVPLNVLGIIIAVCQRRGYQLRGVRRTRMTQKRCHSLGLSTAQMAVFSPSCYDNFVASPRSPRGPDKNTSKLYSPSTILLLNKENAAHNVASLIEGFMVQLTFRAVMDSIQERTSQPITSSVLFHAATYNSGLLQSLGGNFSKIPEHDLLTMPGYISPKLYTNPEVEEIAVLILTGHVFMQTFGMSLSRLLNMMPYKRTKTYLDAQPGYELLGIKWLPGLNYHQAREITPYEVGDKEWKSSIHTLTSEPAVILVLRAVNALQRLRSNLFPHASGHVLDEPVVLDKILSPTPEVAYRLATLFFTDRELFPDTQSRQFLKYFPPARNTGDYQAYNEEDSHKSSNRQQLPPQSTKDIGIQEQYHRESILHTMLSGPRLITTVLILKPGAVKKNLGKIMKKIANEGFYVVGMRLMVMDETKAASLVPPHLDESLRTQHIDYLHSAPSMVLCLQRENAVKKLCDLIGPDDPLEARKYGTYLWRGMFGLNVVANGLYACSSYTESVKVREIFFPEGLSCQETVDLNVEGVTCPCVDVLVDPKFLKQRQVILKQSGLDNGIQYTDHPISLLTQTNCIVLSPPLLKPEVRSKRFGYAEIMDSLLSHGFEVVGCKMIWLTSHQAQHYLFLAEAGNFNKVPMLVSGPSIVLAVQRDNAVVAFDSILTSHSDSIYTQYEEKILKAKTQKQADSHLCFFFDSLLPNVQATITQLCNPN